MENVAGVQRFSADVNVHILGSFQNIEMARTVICNLILANPPSDMQFRILSFRRNLLHKHVYINFGFILKAVNISSQYIVIRRIPSKKPKWKPKPKPKREPTQLATCTCQSFRSAPSK